MTSKSALAFLDVLQRDPGAGVPLFAVLVVQHRVAVGEGAARRILAGKAHAVALVEQARVGERLAHAPVERQLALAHGAAVGDDLLHPRMQLEIRRHVGDLARQRLERLQRHRGSAASVQCLPRKGVQSTANGGL